MTSAEEKYKEILQNILNDKGVNLHIKSISFKTGNNRCICLAFTEKGKMTNRLLSTSAMQYPSLSKRCISGERHLDYTDEENMETLKVTMIVANYFWLWLTWFDFYILTEVPKYGNNVMNFLLSAHKDRMHNFPDECGMFTFEEKIKLYNEQVKSGIFKSSAKSVIDVEGFDLENFKYIEPENNIY